MIDTTWELVLKIHSPPLLSPDCRTCMSATPLPCDDTSPGQALPLAWEALEPPGTVTEQVNSSATVALGKELAERTE